MNNKMISGYFHDIGVAADVDHRASGPNEMWQFTLGGFPFLIQTQENANRMRIVAFITRQHMLGEAELVRMLEANYHSALDARYALADQQVVSLFLHPFEELDGGQFVMGLYQVLGCAQSFGSEYAGGTMTFGPSSGGEGAMSHAEDRIGEISQSLQSMFRSKH